MLDHKEPLTEAKMIIGIGFFLKNGLLGVGLAMDAFTVSLANGLNEPCMKKRKMCAVAGVFALFQAVMPMIGWACVHTLLTQIKAFELFIPWLSLVLLCFIGGKMLCEAGENTTCERKGGVGVGALLLQGIATSIDALSVGFTIASYGLTEAALAALLIALVTFLLCMVGLSVGKKAGTKLAAKAGVLGGVLLILIGLEIFIKGIL